MPPTCVPLSKPAQSALTYLQAMSDIHFQGSTGCLGSGHGCNSPQLVY